MGKGSGNCDRPGISLTVTDGTETESTLSGEVASISEINTALKLQRPGHRWFTKDERAVFQKTREGWEALSFSDPVHKAFEEYGITGTIEDEPICFPSLKAARQAVTDVSLEAELNIDSRLTRQKSISYNIGDLPLSIKREKDWRVYAISGGLPQSLKKHFNSPQDFRAAWYVTGPVATHYPTRKAAHQAAINWLSQTVAKGK